MEKNFFKDTKSKISQTAVVTLKCVQNFDVFGMIFPTLGFIWKLSLRKRLVNN